MSHEKYLKDPRIIYGLVLSFIIAATASASSLPAILNPSVPMEIHSEVINLDENDLQKLRQNEAEEVFTLIVEMEQGNFKPGEAKDRIQDYKSNAKNFNPANAVEAEVNRQFIDFCNSGIDCTNAIYYGANSPEYIQVYSEMESKKELI